VCGFSCLLCINSVEYEVMKVADFFEKSEEYVVCTLCPHNCKLSQDEFGICGVRQHVNGELISHVYEKAIAANSDPIEKKPLFHVHPGSLSFSVATAGCNFRCGFCQNHEISQVQEPGMISGDYLPVDQVVKSAKKGGCRTIACTYTEPTVYYEYAFDIAEKAAKKGLDTVFVSNGFINPKPLKKIAPFLTAANFDLKGWNDRFYQDIIGGDLKSVLHTIELAKKLGVFVEITTLVVPGYVDNLESLNSIADFIKTNVGKETPWHISRFYPTYLFNRHQPTRPQVIHDAREIGYKHGLYYVYTGNLPGDAENTTCWSCGETVIERSGYHVTQNKVRKGKCPNCGAVIHGVGMG